MNSFSIAESLREAWKLFRNHWFFLISTLLILAVVNLIPSMLAELVSEQSFLLSMLFRVIGWFVNIVTSIGILKITTGLVKGQTVRYGDLFNGYPRFISYFLTSFMVGIIVLLGFILLIIPGIIFSARLQFALYYAVEGGLGPIGAIQASWRATKGHVLQILALDILIVLLSLVGMAVLFVGLLITAPISALAVASAYKRLSAAS